MREVHHNRFEGGLARCSIYDLSNNKILSDESVVNGGSYELINHRGIYILDIATDIRQSTIKSPKFNLQTDIQYELASLKAKLSRLQSNVGTLEFKMEKLNPESFPRFYAWRSEKVPANNDHLVFNEIKYNDGEMYDVKSGKATIQYDGMYIFSTSLYKFPYSGNVYFFIYVNDEVYAKSGT